MPVLAIGMQEKDCSYTHGEIRSRRAWKGREENCSAAPHGAALLMWLKGVSGS